MFNALERSTDPRWLTKRAFTGALLDAQRLEPGADVVRAFLAAMLELLDAGWVLGEFSSAGAVVRYSRGSEQRLLTVEHVDPEHRGSVAAWDGQGIKSAS